MHDKRRDGNCGLGPVDLFSICLPISDVSAAHLAAHRQMPGESDCIDNNNTTTQAQQATKK